MEVKVSHSVVSDSLWPHGLYNPWNSLGQKTGVGSLSVLQGIFPTQRLNPGLPHCRQFLYQLSHKGSPRILEWVAYPFSSGSSGPRNGTWVSCVAGEFFTNWAVREVFGTHAAHNHESSLEPYPWDSFSEGTLYQVCTVDLDSSLEFFFPNVHSFPFIHPSAVNLITRAITSLLVISSTFQLVNLKIHKP